MTDIIMTDDDWTRTLNSVDISGIRAYVDDDEAQEIEDDMRDAYEWRDSPQKKEG